MNKFKTAKFAKNDLRELIFSGDDSNFEMVQRPELIDSGRWDLIYEFIFKYDGKFYKGYYTTGATESQDHCAFEYEDDPMECTEVRPVEKTVIVYDAVPEE